MNGRQEAGEERWGSLPRRTSQSLFSRGFEIDIYERNARAWDASRGPGIEVERKWIDRFTELLPPGGTILDIGAAPVIRSAGTCSPAAST